MKEIENVRIGACLIFLFNSLPPFVDNKNPSLSLFFTKSSQMSMRGNIKLIKSVALL